MKTLVSITLVAALIGGGLLMVNGAEAGAPKVKQYQAYDQFWLLKHPGSPVELNPQPLPPGEIASFNKGGPVSINPQPLPPRYLNAQTGFGNPGALVGFNPQPDPPGLQ